MAKDGTNRGGARIGAGRKAKPLDEKFIDGDIFNPTKQKDKSIFRIPTPKAYLDADQKSKGGNYKTCAKQVYKETFNWLKSCNCAEFVSPQLVENFAQTMARHIQAEQAIADSGLLARHPTTGEPMTSPLIKISLDYLKAAQQLWYQISQIIKQYGVEDYDNTSDVMENLLSFRKER